MKHKYLLVRNPLQFDRNTVVFCLWVGMTKVEQTQLALLMEVAKDCRWLLRKWDDKADMWLSVMSAGIYPTLNWPTGHIRRADMNVRDFYREFEAKNLEAIENNLVYPKHFLSQLSVTDPDEHFNIEHRAKPSPALSVKRKYLNNGEWSEGKRATINFCLILALLALDALVSWLFNF